MYRSADPHAKPYSTRSPKGEGDGYWLRGPPVTALVWVAVAEISRVPDQNQRKSQLCLVLA